MSNLIHKIYRFFALVSSRIKNFFTPVPTLKIISKQSELVDKEIEKLEGILEARQILEEKRRIASDLRKEIANLSNPPKKELIKKDGFYVKL